MNRRHFMQSALYSSLLYGAGGIPGLVQESAAGFAGVRNRTLCNLFLNGGPDFRHLIVPAWNASPNSFGNKYWKNRWRSHGLEDSSDARLQARWNNDYFHITVGGQNWAGNNGNGSNLDSGNLNSGVTFGIWRQAGWLIDMFRAGNVALVFNAAGGRNRAHDLSALQLNQGNLLSGLNDRDRSGWGGRLARSAGGNAISVTNTPSPFNFGPVGAAPNYNINAIDNRNLITVQDSRNMGLNEADLTVDQFWRPNQRMARALRNYYTGLKGEQVRGPYEKFMDHESKVREFGKLIRARLSDLEIPDEVRALYENGVSIGGRPVNPSPDTGEARRVLRNNYSWGRQIRNLFDVLASNDLLSVRTVSMQYDNWDSHAGQRLNPDLGDLNNPDIDRGIESNFKDIFGGQFGNNPSDGNALHGGYSALWKNLAPNNRNKLVITAAGEFGRQLKDNGDRGTDHGVGNLMMVIGDDVNGGVFGKMFPNSEVDLYDNPEISSPDIEPRTDLDFIFSEVCDWVASGSGRSVFPRLTATGLNPEDTPILEAGVSLSGIL